MFTGDNRDRVKDNHFIHVDKYNFNFNFPIPYSDITIFEKRNTNISVNVYGLNQIKRNNIMIVYPLKVVEEEKSEQSDLLMLIV